MQHEQQRLFPAAAAALQRRPDVSSSPKLRAADPAAPLRSARCSLTEAAVAAAGSPAGMCRSTAPPLVSRANSTTEEGGPSGTVKGQFLAYTFKVCLHVGPI